MKRPYHSDAQRGVTLIELLVAVVIGLVVVLAATQVVLIGESHKRTTNSNNDIGQTGAFAAYSLDRAIRSAGSGFAQAWDQGVFGCRLSASNTVAGTILPRTASAFPVPFQAFLGGAGAANAGSLPMAPVLIGLGQSAGASDVIMVMSGNGGSGDSARPIRGVVNTNDLRLDNTIGLHDADIGLVTQTGNAACMLEEVDAPDATLNAVGNEVAPMGGKFFNPGGTALGAVAGSTTAAFSTLGNANANNVQFQLFGVDANRTLVAYDLLRSGATAGNTDPTQPLAEGVSELHGAYGLDTNNDDIVDAWVRPTGAWAIANVVANPLLMRQIVAVRLALVMRSSNFEKQRADGTYVTVERPALFGDVAAIALPAVPAAGDDRNFRLRVVDTTIPLRNMLLLP